MRRLLAGAVLALSALASHASAADLNKPAPGFTVYPFKQPKLTLADLKGKVVVLNYWATWCGPCKAELIAFDTYLKQHPNADLRVFAIETEHSLPAYFVKKMQDAAHFTLATSLDGRGYHVLEGLPTSYVIDRNGVVRHAKAGAFTEASFAQLVEPLLAEPAPVATAAK